jgi:hypothetical protein
VRTTITLADDVAAAVEALTRKRGAGISDAVNELVRRGMRAQPPRARFTQQSSDMGPALLPIDDVAGVLEALDGPSAR